MNAKMGSPSGEYPPYPRVAVGAVVIRDGCVLLVRRKNPPAKDFWAIPGGRVELGETLQAAAERELKEETGMLIRAGEPIFTFETIDRDDKGIVRFHYVIIDLMAEYISGEISCGDDALDARWISSQELDRLEVNKMTRRLLRQQFGF